MRTGEGGAAAGHRCTGLLRETPNQPASAAERPDDHAHTTKERNVMSEKVTKSATPKRSHEAYIREVIAELTERHVETGAVLIAFAPARLALVPITVDVGRQTGEQSGLTGAQWVMLRWHEAKGWAWQVRYTQDPGPRTAVYFGGSTAPPAAHVASWLHRCLLRPEIIPVRLGTPSTPEDLDNVLRRYEVTKAKIR